MSVWPLSLWGKKLCSILIIPRFAGGFGNIDSEKSAAITFMKRCCAKLMLCCAKVMQRSVSNYFNYCANYYVIRASCPEMVNSVRMEPRAKRQPKRWYVRKMRKIVMRCI